jgi:phosphoribosylformylglycinamidine synthase subunit PurQ / glutaminase
MKWGVVVFPGSNCDRDCVYALRSVLGQDVTEVWHEDQALPDVDAVVLPGGFSYGDYLRSGAIASTASIMPGVRAHAAAGKPVLGICNGFQILTEAGLLPGALVRNASLRFRCVEARVRVESPVSAFTAMLPKGTILRLPIAHGEGAYVADTATLAALEATGRVILRYCDADGAITEAANPNGSTAGIAGIANATGNVVGMMPHPERASELLLGSADGRRVFESAIAWFAMRPRESLGTRAADARLTGARPTGARPTGAVS